MSPLKKLATALILYLLILLATGPFWVSRACASGPNDGRYCSPQRTWHYLKLGGDGWLWFYPVLLALFTIGLVLDDDDETTPPSDAE